MNSRGPRRPGPVSRASLTGPAHRRLPVHGAGEIDVPYVIQGSVETIDRDTTWTAHSHPTHELVWNDHGVSSATIDARTWTITPTIGLWIPAGTLHSGWTPAGTRHRAAQFSIDRVPSISDGPTTVEVSPLLRLLLDRLDQTEIADSSRSTTESMVLDVLRPAPRELLLRVPESPVVAAIVETVRADPGDSTTLAEWADRLGVSTRTITRAFAAETGLGFARWVAIARAQHAIAMLAHGESIDDIAERTGYRSASAFGTAFRRVTGTTPGRFRTF